MQMIMSIILGFEMVKNSLNYDCKYKVKEITEKLKEKIRLSREKYGEKHNILSTNTKRK